MCLSCPPSTWWSASSSPGSRASAAAWSGRCCPGSDTFSPEYRANEVPISFFYMLPLSRQMPTGRELLLGRRRQWSRHGAPLWGGCASGPSSSSAPPPAACSSSSRGPAPPSSSSSPPAAASVSFLEDRAACQQSWTGIQGFRGWKQMSPEAISYLGVLPHWDGDLGWEPDRPLVVNIKESLLSTWWTSSSLHASHLWNNIAFHFYKIWMDKEDLVQSAWIPAHSVGWLPPAVNLIWTFSFFGKVCLLEVLTSGKVKHVVLRTVGFGLFCLPLPPKVSFWGGGGHVSILIFFNFAPSP